MARAPLIAGIEVRKDKVVVMVGEPGEGGSIGILGMGESSYGIIGSNVQSQTDGIKEAVDNASENSQCCIRYLHLVSSDLDVSSEGATSNIDDKGLLQNPPMPEYLAKIFDDPTLKEDIEIIEVLPKGYCAALAVTSPEQRKISIIVINASETSLDYAVCQDDKWMAIGSESLDGKSYGEATSLILDKLSHNPEFPILPEVIVTGLKEVQDAIRKFVQDKTKQPCKAGSPTGFHGAEFASNPDYSALLGIVRHGMQKQPAFKSSAWGDFKNFIEDIWNDIKLYWRIRQELRKRKDRVVAK